MGDIRTSANSTFADYNTSGDAASGSKSPVKSEIRALFGVVEDADTALQDQIDVLTSGVLTYATKAAIDADTTQADGQLAYVTDDGTASNNGVYRFTAGSPGSWAKTALQFASATDLAAIQAVVTNANTIEDDAFIVTGVDGSANEVVLLRIPAIGDPDVFGFSGDGSSAEIEDARGSRESLDIRLSQSLDDYGLPLTDAIWPSRLRQTQMRLRRLSLGDSTQLIFAMIGDSWTRDKTSFSAKVADSLIDTYGDAGAGYCGFAYTGSNYNNFARTDATVERSGTWTDNYNSEDTADICSVTTTDTATPAEITVTFPAGQTSAILHYTATADGAIRYRWNGGSWESLTLSGSGFETATLVAPGGSDTTLEIQPTAGTVKMAGVDLRSTAAGVRVHKLAAAGSRTDYWVAQDWSDAVASLAPHAVMITLGVNDRSTNTPAVAASNLTTIIEGLRTASPGCDVLIVAPPNLPDASTYDMDEYALTYRTVAAENDCAFLSLQDAFGPSTAGYAYGSSRPWIGSDGIHPDGATGGAVIADRILNIIKG